MIAGWVPRLVRRGGRRYAQVYQGVLKHRTFLEFVWRCDHAHSTKLEAQQCAEHEAWYRGIPVPLSVGGNG